MTLKEDVNFEELARSTDEFNAAQLKAVCVEAGMIALREGAVVISHEHFHSGIAEGEWFPIMFRGTRMLIMCLLRSTSEEEKPTHLLRLVLRLLLRRLPSLPSYHFPCQYKLRKYKTRKPYSSRGYFVVQETR